MKRKFYFKKLLVLTCLLTLTLSCQNTKEHQITSLVPVEVQKKKTKKDYDKKKGIEIIAYYRSSLLKPIGAENSTYENGYLMMEFKKAKKKSTGAKIKWKERGPVNVPGRIRGIVVAPDDPEKWYAGTVGGGLWMTKDAGQTWKNLTDYKVPNLSTSTVAISESNPEILYVGTGEPFNNLDAIGGIGLIKTQDGGKKWEYLTNTRNFGGVGRLALNPNDEDYLVVASSTGIYVTEDGGATWQQTYNAGNVQDLNHDPTNFNILYGGVRNVGIIKSTDGGLTWALVFDRADYNPVHQRFELDISPINPNKVYVSVYTPSGLATTAVSTDLYVTDDAGATFTLLGFEGSPAQGNLVTGQGWYDNIITAHPFDETIFYVGGIVMHKVQIDENLNYTFQPIAAGYGGELNNYVHVDQHGLICLKNEEGDFRLILTNDGGVYYTDYLPDPGTTLNDWSTAATGLNCTQFYGADKRNGSDDYIAGAQDNGTWISFTEDGADKKTQYQAIIGGDGFESLWNYDDPNKFIGGSQYNNFVRYVNGVGARVRHGESGRGTSPFYSKIVNSNNNPDVLFSPSVSGVWRSTNFAESWDLTPIPQNFSVGASSALDVGVSIANPDIVWAGNAMTESGFYSMHVSRDNGISFEAVPTFSDPRTGRAHNYFISGLETSPTNENRAYVLFSGQGAAKILKTEDLGQTWLDISGFTTGEDTGFPDVAIHSILEMPFDENMIFAGTDIGVFQTLNGGQNWELLTDFPTVSVWQMKIVNDQVVMATHGRGVWTAKLKELKDYEPPVYFAPPIIVEASQESIENQNGTMTYTQGNQNIEELVVYLDGEEVDRITDNIAADTEFGYTFENLSEGEHVLGLQAVGENQISIISSETIVVIDFENPEPLVSINTFVPSDVYTFGGEFVINTLAETVSQPVLNNSDHPYLNNSEYRAVLKRPIEVSSTYGTFSYEDVAITEFDPTPGQFFDFVAVEASSDLKNWVRMDTYDAERFPEWTDAFNSGPSPAINDGLFKEQSVNLLNFFTEGDVIAIRFRLISDPLFTSFGWAIRSINKQDTPMVTAATAFESSKISIFPTVSNGEVNITSDIAIENSTIEVFGMNGLKVFEKEMSVIDESRQNLSLGNLYQGIYLVKIKSQGLTKTQRIVIN